MVFVRTKLPNTISSVSFVPGKTQSEQIFFCSGSARVSTDLTGADNDYVLGLNQSHGPCVTRGKVRNVAVV